jgi:hypothetical protein
MGKDMQDSFDLYGAALPKEFEMGCLSIRNAHLWRLSHMVWEGSAKSVGATFFCDLKEPWEDRSLLRVEMFRLPEGSGDFAERLEWYTKYRKKRRIKIADGQLFDEEFLHMPTFGEGWEMDSFALSKGEVIRIYQASEHAVIFRFLARSGTLLDHPIFKRLIKNITFDSRRWETKAPDIIEKPMKQKVVDTVLPSEEQRELRRILSSAVKRLGITEATIGLGVAEA